MTVESECEMAERHVQQAEQRVWRQREMILEFAQFAKSPDSQRLENACALLWSTKIRSGCTKLMFDPKDGRIEAILRSTGG